MNEIISARGVYRTASPTPGLLSIFQKLDKKMYCFWFLAGYLNISEKKKKKKKKKIQLKMLVVFCMIIFQIFNIFSRTSLLSSISIFHQKTNFITMDSKYIIKKRIFVGPQICSINHSILCYIFTL